MTELCQSIRHQVHIQVHSDPEKVGVYVEKTGISEEEKKYLESEGYAFLNETKKQWKVVIASKQDDSEKLEKTGEKSETE